MIGRYTTKAIETGQTVYQFDEFDELVGEWTITDIIGENVKMKDNKGWFTTISLYWIDYTG